MTYVETSARASTKGVKDAFEVAALAALGKLNKQQMKQQVLNTILLFIYNNILLKGFFNVMFLLFTETSRT